MFNRVELFLAFCLSVGALVVCLPILPLLLAVVCSLLYMFVSRNASNLAYFRRICFRACGFDREVAVNPSSFLFRMTIAQISFVVISLFLLLLYIVPLVFLLSPRFAKPLTRVEVTKCNETSSGLRINEDYLLKSENVSCDDVRGSDVYSCNVFESTNLSAVELNPCRVNLGAELNIFVLGSNSLLILLTLLANAMNIVHIAQIQRIASLKPMI